MEKIEALLETYSLEELLEMCEITPAEAVLFLVDNGAIILPDKEEIPVSIHETSS